jgi:hypothetical protein
MSEGTTGKNLAIEKLGRGAVASESENPTEKTCQFSKTLKVARPAITQKGYPAVCRTWNN